MNKKLDIKIFNLLPEVKEYWSLANQHPDLVRIKTLGVVKESRDEYPIHALEIGSEDKSVPTLGLFGGVHGLERIGTQVLLSYLYNLEQRLNWDNDLREQFKTRRIVCIPIVNPWGMAHHRRSNINGVDLMRNAPVEAKSATFLGGGHRISNKLPWYRGALGAPMEFEAATLTDFVFPRNVSFHSKPCIGFTLRLWS
jgi:murein tripeptide amidase MpaA